MCEVGAMIAMASGFTVQTSAGRKGGGFWAGVKRMVAGENFFLNRFTATGPSQELILGPGLVGDVIHHRLTGGALIVQVARAGSLRGRRRHRRQLSRARESSFLGEGVFWVKCTGAGDVFLNSFGAICEVPVDGKYIVDTGHIVAFEDTLQFEVGKLGDSWMESYLSGEGLVCHFRGTGKLYCQSHNPPSFGKLLGPMLYPR